MTTLSGKQPDITTENRLNKCEMRPAHPGGTPQYMPPEMARGDAGSLGPQSDIYLLGSILLEIVTGKPPHFAGTVLDTLLFASANAIQVDTDHPLMEVIKKALATSPKDRYASVAALRSAVRECLALDKCRAHMATANELHAKAVQEDGYTLFQEAIAEYDAALAAYPEYKPAQRDRLRALMAYSRKALAGGEYDLALTVIKSDVAHSTKAAVLADTVSRLKAQAAWKRRRSRIIVSVLFAAILLGGGGAVYIYLANRAGIDNLVQTAGSYDERMEANRSMGRYSGIRNEVRHLSATVSQAMASDSRKDRQLVRSYKEMQEILSRCEEEFRFPDQTDSARRDAACRYVLEQHPRLAQLVARMTSRDVFLFIPQQPLPDIARQFAKFTEFIEDYKKKGL